MWKEGNALLYASYSQRKLRNPSERTSNLRISWTRKITWFWNWPFCRPDTVTRPIPPPTKALLSLPQYWRLFIWAKLPHSAATFREISLSLPLSLSFFSCLWLLNHSFYLFATQWLGWKKKEWRSGREERENYFLLPFRKWWHDCFRLIMHHHPLSIPRINSLSLPLPPRLPPSPLKWGLSGNSCCCRFKSTTPSSTHGCEHMHVWLRFDAWMFFSGWVTRLFKCLTTCVAVYVLLVRVCGCCVYLTFVPLCRQWAGIYPVATNAADRKDERGDMEVVRRWQLAIWTT